MKFTLSWLKEFLDTTASLDEISAKLTAIGLEVDDIVDRSAALAVFTVAEILHAEKHPEADKLRVCRVMSDVGELQIVCGAPNARAGIKVALAKEGALIPANGMVIKKSKIRGVESNGMLCSAAELGLSGDSEGILELPLDAKIGTPIADVLGLDDPVIDINVTPNRADCLGVYGVARDLAAAGMGTLKPISSFPEFAMQTIGEPMDRPIMAPGHSGDDKITLSTPNCPLFIATTISGVKNGPSPAWLKTKLEAVGLRSISTLVDITNYFTIAYARPLHVFDAAKLSGGITVREARAGEMLKALDGKEYTLAPGMTVIADDKNALGIGGIIGGEASGCTEMTTDVVLETALFNPINIAETGRKLEILSDARFRFERGVDPGFAKLAAAMAAEMIVELWRRHYYWRDACGRRTETIS